MTNNNKLGTLAIILLFALGIESGHSQPAPPNNQDTLFIGDDGDNSVKQFRASDGQYLGAFVKSVAGLHGPMGMVVPSRNELLVVDQNTNTSTRSDILLFDASGLVARVVSNGDPNAPGVGRGIILNDGLWVAEFSGQSQQSKPPTPGRLLHYSVDGTFLKAFTPPANTSLGACTLPTTPPTIIPGEFHPRGIVKGPDGLLYVSNYPCVVSGVGGQVLRFNADGSFHDVFVAAGVADLNRPEGLVFGPDGHLYITSFKLGRTASNTSGNDKILIFQGPGGPTPGAYLDKIDLDADGGTQTTRSYAQALLFGPDGKLYIPITANDPNTTGSVRRYDVTTKFQEVFVPTGTLQSPYYLTFGKTNAATLTYPAP